MVMAYGITVGNCKNIGDTKVEPYSTSKRRKGVMPTSAMLIDEVARRCLSTNIAPVKCKSYPKPKLISWLLKNPVDKPVDVAFLTQEVVTFCKQFINAAQEKSNLMPTEATRKLPWITTAPFLCLYHCLLDDDVKKAFLKKDDALSCQQLNGNKSTKRPPTYEELVTELFNDPKFLPISLELPELHEEFTDKCILDFKLMPGLITAVEVKTRLADSRTKLVLVSTSCACPLFVWATCLTLFYSKNKR